MRALIFLLAFTTLSAQAFTGTPNDKEEEWQAYLQYRNSDSLEGFETTDWMAASWFIGVISGLSDVFNDLGYNSSVCYPTGASPFQLADIAAKFIKESPEHRAKPMAYNVWLSHALAFGLDSEEDCWSHEAWIDYNFDISGEDSSDPF